MIDKAVHNELLVFIDKKTYHPNWDYGKYRCCLVLDRSNNPWQHIFLCNETNPSNIVWRVSKNERGLFYHKHTILIHRSDLTKPNKSYCDEVITALHEYGHYTSIHKGDITDGIMTTEFGCSSIIDKNLQKHAWFIEECNAWKYAIYTIWSLPTSIRIKTWLYIMAPLRAILALHGYLMWAEGIID